MNRRDFLQSSTAAAAISAPASRALAADETDKPLRVALIGTGWYGKTDLFNLIQVAPVEVVGLCDVDSKMVAQAAELVAGRQNSGKRPPTYSDYRKLLAEQKPDIVEVATPDHWHCLPMIDACRAGVDVYVQKPISWDVKEGQAMVAAARKYKRTVQVGLQRRSTPHLLEANERFIKSGKLGKIGWAEVHAYGGGKPRFPEDSDPPEHLDWDTYVGPAPWVNHNPGIHPRRWRSFRPFSNGRTGDLGVHFFDFVRYLLGLGWPKSVSSTGGQLMDGYDPRVNVHDTQTAIFDYDNVNVVWNQRSWGGRQPQPEFGWGAILYGEKGSLKMSTTKYEFVPAGKGVTVRGSYLDERNKYPEDLRYSPNEIHALPATRAHMRNFLGARRQGIKPVCDIEEGHISTACCILANLSMELRRGLAWDPEKQEVPGDEEANSLLARPYREKWTRPTPETV